jgi:proline iminopeptidase
MPFVPPSEEGEMIVPVKGAELFYSTCGSGPKWMVLSGMGTRPYEILTAPLVDDLGLAYVDLRGSGRSTGEPTDMTFDVLADDLEAIRVDLGVERVAVLGHSILGILAIEYGRRRPESVSHVIVAGTPPRGDMAWLSSEATAFFERDASEDRKQALRTRRTALPSSPTLMETILAQTPLRFFDARFDAAPLFADRVGDHRLLMHLIATLVAGWDVAVDAASLRTPIFIAHGRYDYAVPWTLWQDVVAGLPSAALHVFDRSAHHPFFEEPVRFVAAVTDWMTRLT